MDRHSEHWSKHQNDKQSSTSITYINWEDFQEHPSEVETGFPSVSAQGFPAKAAQPAVYRAVPRVAVPIGLFQAGLVELTFRSAVEGV